MKLTPGRTGAAKAIMSRAQALPRLPLLLIAAAALGATSPARAALFGDDEARTAIIELRGRFEIQNRESAARLAELNQRIDALGQRLDRLEQVSRGQLELQNQLEQLRQEIARLRGQLEIQTNELAQLQRRQREIYADLDGRIKPFEPVSVQIDGRTATVEVDERKAYETALAAFRGGDFAGSAAAFGALRSRWPSSAYGANALYWIGSAQFALKDYRAALATHQQFIARHADHPRAADAMLSVALSQIETGDKRGARRTLEVLIEKYPDSPAAPQARERLTTLK
ncbi:MAG TPA: tol-pal system protein YbgF [Burkholderiaceae bacterium]|jgi:tol-pal system protein YbgF|nr:tol-pal system protein YbgF [Burkholderiaceae bacterium]